MTVCTVRRSWTGDCSAIISDDPTSRFKVKVHDVVKSRTVVRVCHNGDPRGGCPVSAYIFGRPGAGHAAIGALLLGVCLIVSSDDAWAVEKGKERTSCIANTSVVTTLSTYLLEG